MTRSRLFLSHRNVETLLSKLRRRDAGEHTFATLIKRDDTHPVYPQTMRTCVVKADAAEQWYENDMVDEVCLSKMTLKWLIQPGTPGTVSVPSEGGVIDIAVISDDVYYADRQSGAVSPNDAQ